MRTQLIFITPKAEASMAYIARVSSSNQDNPEHERLLNYCIEHGHWSVFEHAHATFEITTSRAIAAQILRHRSFCFQELSQRYAESPDHHEYVPARRQSDINRQGSTDAPVPESLEKHWKNQQDEVWAFARRHYVAAREAGIARELARMLLPLSTTTKMYMTGNIRSWIHYLAVRTDETVQAEHRQIALEIQAVLAEELPVLAKALGWTK